MIQGYEATSRYFVKRGSKIDLRELCHNVPGKVMLMPDFDGVIIMENPDWCLNPVQDFGL